MAASTVEDLLEMGRAARTAARKLARLSSQVKNQALHNIADALDHDQSRVLAANDQDYRGAKADGLSEAVDYGSQVPSQGLSYHQRGTAPGLEFSLQMIHGRGLPGDRREET